MQVSGLSAAWHPDGKRISIWVLHAPADLETFRAASFWTALATGGSAVTSELSPEILKKAEAIHKQARDAFAAARGNTLLGVFEQAGTD